MKKTEFNLELLEELDSLLDLSKTQIKRIKVPVTYDGNQYSLKIPKKLAKLANLDQGDSFEFISLTDFTSDGFQSQLKARVLKQNNKKSINTE